MQKATVKTAKGRKPMRVWHIPQIPGKAYHVPVASIKEAKKILIVLAEYDLFQLKHNIKGDYANAAGLQELNGKQWEDWCNEDGDSIDDLIRKDDEDKEEDEDDDVDEEDEDGEEAYYEIG